MNDFAHCVEHCALNGAVLVALRGTCHLFFFQCVRASFFSTLPNTTLDLKINSSFISPIKTCSQKPELLPQWLAYYHINNIQWLSVFVKFDFLYNDVLYDTLILCQLINVSLLQSFPSSYKYGPTQRLDHFRYKSFFAALIKSFQLNKFLEWLCFKSYDVFVSALSSVFKGFI